MKSKEKKNKNQTKGNKFINLEFFRTYNYQFYTKNKTIPGHFDFD